MKKDLRDGFVNLSLGIGGALAGLLIGCLLLVVVPQFRQWPATALTLSAFFASIPVSFRTGKGWRGSIFWLAYAAVAVGFDTMRRAQAEVFASRAATDAYLSARVPVAVFAGLVVAAVGATLYAVVVIHGSRRRR